MSDVQEALGLIHSELVKTRVAVQYLANLMAGMLADRESPDFVWPFPEALSADPSAQSEASEHPRADGASGAVPAKSPSLDLAA